jgi:hypothetical protein
LLPAAGDAGWCGWWAGEWPGRWANLCAAAAGEVDGEGPPPEPGTAGSEGKDEPRVGTGGGGFLLPTSSRGRWMTGD